MSTMLTIKTEVEIDKMKVEMEKLRVETRKIARETGIMPFVAGAGFMAAATGLAMALLKFLP